MKKDNFKKIFPFSNAIGDDNTDTGLYVGSKGGDESNVADLQRALNKLGGRPQLKVDGNFGDKTKKSVVSLGYSYPVMSATFYKILGDANSGIAPPIKPKSTFGNIFTFATDTLSQGGFGQGKGGAGAGVGGSCAALGMDTAPDGKTCIEKKSGLSGTTWAIIGVSSVVILVGGYLLIKGKKPKVQSQLIPTV